MDQEGYLQWNFYIKTNLGTPEMWSLYTGGLYMPSQWQKVYTWEPVKCGLCKLVVFIYMWSLEPAWLYVENTGQVSLMAGLITEGSLEMEGSLIGYTVQNIGSSNE